MKALSGSLLAGMLFCAAVNTPALAQSPPDRGEELIDNIFLHPWAPYDAWFPNVFDLTHHKLLTLDVYASSLSPFPGLPGAPAPVRFKFDWIDPTGGPQFSDTWEFIVGDVTHLSATWEIPYCPQQVSIHFEMPTTASGGTTVVLYDGLFVHECMVPEASETAMLMGMGALGFGVIRWYRKPRTA
jgi:hypothetical protein